MAAKMARQLGESRPGLRGHDARCFRGQLHHGHPRPDPGPDGRRGGPCALDLCAAHAHSWDDPIKPSVLRRYLEWWDGVFAPELEKAHAYGLLGVSFIVRKPAKFREIMEKELPTPALSQTVVNVLDEMERLAKKDLRDFVHTHRIPLPPGRLERLLDQVLVQTQGHYDLTLDALKSLEERAWDLANQTGDRSPIGPSDEGDY